MKRKYFNISAFEFSTPSMWRTIFNFNLTSWILIAITLILLIYNVLCLLKLNQTVTSQTKELTQLRQNPNIMKKNVSNQNIVHLSAEDLKLQNELISELNIPWSDFFDALESETATIALISVEPNIQKRSLKIQAEARSRSEMNKFLNKIERSDRFKEVVLHSFETNLLDPIKPLRFSLEMSWKEIAS